MSTVTVDPVWEEKYASGHREHAPWDAVVSFLFRNAPKAVPRAEVRVLEIGCGTGSNLVFAAQQGFAVSGIDCSPSAIAIAQKALMAANLCGDMRVGDFTTLPFAEGSFDLVIDRGALTCVGRNDAARAVAEVRRVIKPGGCFFANPYSDRHSSRASGEPGPDGLRLHISAGSLTGVGQICFYGRNDIETLFLHRWAIRSLTHVESIELSHPLHATHAEWRVVLGALHE
jgi:SAM-dependent methyltransferase